MVKQILLTAYTYWGEPREDRELMGCMKLFRSFQITPEPDQGPKHIVPFVLVPVPVPTLSFPQSKHTINATRTSQE